MIAGRLRSRPLLAPAGLDTRPTADRLRETLFNVLTQGAIDRVSGARFLDLYAGSGAVGIEALSRGAAAVTFVEQAQGALTMLRKNLDALGLRGESVRVEKLKVARYLKSESEKAAARFGVVFLDPPYDLVAEYVATFGLLGGECAGLLAPDGMVVVEHRKKHSLEASYGDLARERVIEQGDAALSFYQLRK